MLIRKIFSVLFIGWSSCQWAFAAPASISSLRQVVQQNPQSLSAWDNLGLAYARAHRFMEAFKALEHARGMDPNAKSIQEHLALVYAWSADYAEAEQRYQDLLKQYPDDQNIRLDYGQTLAWDRRFGAAAEQYQIVLSHDSHNVSAKLHMGVLTAWEGHYKAGLLLLQEALDLDPNNVQVLIAQGEILSWQGDLAKAVDVFSKARRIAPENHEILIKLAQVYLWQGRTRDAVMAYRNAIKIDPSAVEAYLGLSRVYMKNRQHVEAEDILRSAAKLFPNDSRVAESLGRLAAGQQWSLNTVAENAEPLVYIAVLIFMLIYVRRYRRVLPPQYRMVKVVLVLAPLLAFATASAYAVSLFGGQYHQEVTTATHVLQYSTLLALITVFVTLVWLLRFGHQFRHCVVLAIGAHPDDIELGCGATILRYREEGCQTYGLILSGGQAGFEHNGKSLQRVSEAEAGARTLVLNEVRILNFPDTRLNTRKAELRQVIEDEVKRIKPDIVFTHTEHDNHSDHRAVYEATCEAVRHACTILCYENPHTAPSFMPDYFVEVADFIDDKVNAMSRHKSQRRKDYTAPSVIRANAGFRGSQARVKYAEAFMSVRVLDRSMR